MKGTVRILEGDEPPPATGAGSRLGFAVIVVAGKYTFL
jgi:hypothetical protein